MQSRAHAAIGAVVSAALVAVLWPGADLAVAGALWGYGVALSVLIDLDHFVVARLAVGDWRHLRKVLARPAGVLWDQTWIFSEEALDELDRLLSHAVLGGALVAGTWALDPTLATYTAVVLYAHVLADLLRDNEVL